MASDTLFHTLLINRDGQNRRTFDEIPAKNTVYTTYNYGTGQPH